SPQAGAHNREQDGLRWSGVFEVVWKIGIEGHTIAGGELVAVAVVHQHDSAGFDQCGFTAARLVHRGIPGTAGERPGGQHMAGELRPLARKWWGQDLVAVTPPPARSLATI